MSLDEEIILRDLSDDDLVEQMKDDLYDAWPMRCLKVHKSF